MDEKIRHILAAAVQAPSGSNSQPWEFRVNGNAIHILAFPEKDHRILNYRYRGTWVAHGALIENLCIAASAFGYRTSVELHPYESEHRTIATIRLAAATAEKDPLTDAISRRATNRKPYHPDPLSRKEVEEIERSVRVHARTPVKFIENPKVIRRIARAMSVNERVMFEDRTLHALFFEELIWTEDEENMKRSGLFLKTMELKPQQEKALRLFKKWPLAKILNLFGVSRSIARENAALYAASPLIGAIIVRDNDEDFIWAGRAMERIWLTVTHLGLSFHLLTGVPFLWQQVVLGGYTGFGKKHSLLIKEAYNDIVSSFNATDGMPALVFRIGHGGVPSARSSKKHPVIRQ